MTVARSPSGTTFVIPRKRATQSSAGRAQSSSGVATCATRPSRRTATRSPSSNASPTSWVTWTTVSREPLEELPQVGLEPPPERPVERAERLVEEQHLRARRERPGERDALRLAARERRHVAPFGPGEADQLQRLR